MSVAAAADSAPDPAIKLQTLINAHIATDLIELSQQAGGEREGGALSADQKAFSSLTSTTEKDLATMNTT